MSNPEYGMGEMGECRDEAERIVYEWLNKGEIIIADLNKYYVSADSKA